MRRTMRSRRDGIFRVDGFALRVCGWFGVIVEVAHFGPENEPD